MKMPNILIVDDEGEVREMMKNFLANRIKCKIYEAENGDKALKILAKQNCDVMILDIRMPKKSGMRVLDEIAVLGGNLDTLIVTAWNSDLVTEECARRKVECISKPVKFEELHYKVTELLKKRGQFIPIANKA